MAIKLIRFIDRALCGLQSSNVYKFNVVGVVMVILIVIVMVIVVVTIIVIVIIAAIIIIVIIRLEASTLTLPCAHPATLLTTSLSKGVG